MAQDEWTPPAMGGESYSAPAQYPATGQPPQPAPPREVYELRPLSLGEILDRIFQIYRSHFVLFAGLSAASGLVRLVVGLIQVWLQHMERHSDGRFGAQFLSSSGSLVGSLIYWLAVSLTQAATVYALSEVYLGNGAQIGSSLLAIRGRWYRYMGIGLWQVWSALWLPALLVVPGFVLIRMAAGGNVGLTAIGGALVFFGFVGGMVYGVIAFIRNSLAIQAAVIEQTPVRPAMRRSKNLAAGAKGSIFVVFVIAFAVSLAISSVDGPMLFAIGKAPLAEHSMALIGINVVSFFTGTLVTPIVMIGTSLIYFDQRVRKEALDLVMMMGNAPLPVPPVPEAFAAAPPPVEPAGLVAAASPEAAVDVPAPPYEPAPPAEQARHEVAPENRQEGDAAPHE